MPLITDYFSPDPLVQIISGSEVFADGAVGRGVAASIECGSAIVARLVAPALVGVAQIDGSTDLYARGRLNAEPNELGSVSIAGTTTQTMNGRVRSKAKAIVNDLGTTISARGRLAKADSSRLKIFLSIVPDPNTGFGDTLSARIYADGQNYPIRAFEFNEGRADVGTTLNCTLQKPADRAAILAATSFKFEIYTGGIWVEMFDTGKRTGIGFSFAFAEGKPNDVLSVSTSGPIADKLNKSPIEDTTVYDNFREHLDADDFKKIFDTDGHAHVHVLTPIAGLTLFQLIGYVADECGFDGFESDLPDYPIRRADFQVTESLLTGLSAHIGAFSPLIYVQNNILWILDGTKRIPAGFSTPIALNADQYKSAQFTETELNADGYDVTFSDDELDFDYSTDREVIDDDDEIGDFGAPNFQIIERKRTFRDYYKLTNPNVPVRTDKISETETTRANVTPGGFLQVNESVETLNYDSFGLLQTITKEVTGLVPDLTTPGFPNIERSKRSERTEFLYQPDITNPRRKILYKTKKLIQGLVVTDSDNPHLEKPFRQEFTDGLRAGNLSDTQTVAFSDIESTVETVTQNLKGQFEVRARTTNFLTDPPSVINSTTDARSGDISTNAMSSTPQTVRVFRAGAVRTTARIQTLSVGEMPLKYAVPLARRRLENRSQRQGNVSLKGVKLAFGRGFTFELFDRDGFTVGEYIIEGRKITGSNLGLPTQTTTQSLEVIEI